MVVYKTDFLETEKTWQVQKTCQVQGLAPRPGLEYHPLNGGQEPILNAKLLDLDSNQEPSG